MTLTQNLSTFRPFSISSETEVPPVSGMLAILDGDANAESRYELLPTIITDLEASLQLELNESSLYFPPQKDYDGNISEIQEPGYLLIKNIDTGNIVAATNKFLVTDWQETRMEKLQVIETFHSSTLNWFDEKTKNYAFAGVLLEAERAIPLLSLDTDNVKHTYLWSQSFRKLWSEYLRGTKLVENNNICVISLMNNIMFGYPHSINFTTNANRPNLVNFQFQFICAKQHIVGEKLYENYSPDTFNLQKYLQNNPELYDMYLSARVDLETASQTGLNLEEAQARWEDMRNSIINRQISTLLGNSLDSDLLD